MECTVCMERLDAAQRRPKVIPCGHTVCLDCLRQMSAWTCPQCRMEFAEEIDSVENLADNYSLLNLIEKKELRSAGFWCRDCRRVANDDCADLLGHGHSFRSLRKVYAEQLVPKRQRLQDAATAARKVVRALQDAKEAVEPQQEEWRARLRRVEEAQRELQAAADEGRDVEAVRADGVDEQLQDAASLLGARAKCALQLQAKDGTEWKGDVQQAAPDRSVLDPLVLRLLHDGSLAKQVALPLTPGHVATCKPEEELNVTRLCKREDLCKELDDILQDPKLDQVRWLWRVDCVKWPTWCKVLLQRVSPRLQTLLVDFPLREHLDVIQAMPALRCLHVHMADCNQDAPDLPLHLEDLAVQNVPAQYLQTVQRMPNLRKLTLNGHDKPLDVQFPPLPQGHRGLQWLAVGLHPASTVLSLASAHAATLQELRILCASEGDTPWHFHDLAEGLQQCGLVALRRVVLLRGEAPGFPNEKLPHGVESCRKQKHALWDKLLAVHPQKAARVVKVICGECDVCPDYPILGHFTWQEK